MDIGGVLVTSAVMEPEPTPPGSGFLTVKVMLPICPLATVPVAVSCVEDMRVVVSAAPFNCTAAPLAKCAPLIVTVKAPTAIAAGETEVICGTGFCRVNVAVAVFALSLVSVAVMLTEFADGGNSGAVYCPVEEIVPTAALPPKMLSTDHVRGWLVLVVKAWVAPPRRVAVAGVIAMP